MAEQITYFAIIDDLSTLERPAGVLRRIKHDRGERDETFGADLRWAPSSLLYEYEHGEVGNSFILISEGAADQIVASIQGAATKGE